MKVSLACLALLLAAALSLPAMAQKQEAPKPPPFGAPKEVDPATTIISELNFNETPLADAIDFLHDVVPHFKVMLVRNGPIEADPKVTLRVKQTSLGQVLDLLTKAYPIEITRVPPVIQGDGE